MRTRSDHIRPGGERSEEALGPYLRAVRAHPLVVVAAMLVAAGVSIAALALRDSTYEATANILVTPLSQGDPAYIGLGLLTDSGERTRTVQTAASLVDSPAAATQVAEALGEGWTRERVDDQVTVEPLGESDILAVTATADDPQMAARIATDFGRFALAERTERLQAQVAAQIRAAEQALPQRGERSSTEEERVAVLRGLAVEDDPTLSLSQEATAPTSPVGAPASVIVILALAAGFTLGSLAAVLIERFGRTVRDAAELEDILPVPVLARVPLHRSSRKSVLDVLPAEREAFRSLQIQLEQGSTGATRTVVITSATAGDGKTTVAVNLACALVGAGHQVILLELDLRRPTIGQILKLESPLGIASVLSSGRKLGEILQSPEELAPLRVAAAGTEGEGATLVEAMNRRLAALFREARLLADYVVVDTPPLGQVSDALPAVAQADDTLVVARLRNTHSSELIQLRDLVQRTGRHPTGLVVLGDTEPGGLYTYGSPPASGRQTKQAVVR